eukprot:5977625-Pyramimonas_sp.AAC.1
MPLQSGELLVLDHGTDIFIWVGAELAGYPARAAEAQAAAHALAQRLGRGRFPHPVVRAFRCGLPSCDWFSRW